MNALNGGSFLIIVPQGSEKFWTLTKVKTEFHEGELPIHGTIHQALLALVAKQ